MNIEALLNDEQFEVYLDDFLAECRGSKRGGARFKVYLGLMLQRALDLGGSSNGKTADFEPANEGSIPPPPARAADAPEARPRPEPVDLDAAWESVIQSTKASVGRILNDQETVIPLPAGANPSEAILRFMQAGIQLPPPMISPGNDGAFQLVWNMGGGGLSVGGL